MADQSSIEWTDATWNPVSGCTKVSTGCKNCYADRMANRLRAMGVARYQAGFKLTLQPDVISAPLAWKKPRLIFVNSMSDLFHEEVPVDYLIRVFAVMNQCEHHVFQILTKRSERAAELAKCFEWTPNIWLGTSVENQEFVGRIRDLVRTPASTRFLSLEPLLGPIPRVPLRGIDWVIAGGESGPGARPMNPDWVRQIRNRCVARSVPFFFKQWGGVQKKRFGRDLDGREWNGFPERQMEKRRDRRFAAAV
jgi:protein gp37